MVVKGLVNPYMLEFVRPAEDGESGRQKRNRTLSGGGFQV
jgi:hypothetical protein